MIFSKVLVTLDLVERRQIDTASKQHDPKPCNSFFWYFFLLRSTKELTIENLSLNKWKTCPVEFSKDCENCEKKHQEVKNQTLEANLGFLKLLNPPLAGTDRSKFFFWLILIYGTSKLEFVYESYGCFTNGHRIRGQNGPEVGKICAGD